MLGPKFFMVLIAKLCEENVHFLNLDLERSLDRDVVLFLALQGLLIETLRELCQPFKHSWVETAHWHDYSPFLFGNMQTVVLKELNIIFS
ncbi:MAG: hypothetical protein WC610_03820 [Patescibacteria group bacterium]